MGLTFALKQACIKVIRILELQGTPYPNVHGVNPPGSLPRKNVMKPPVNCNKNGHSQHINRNQHKCHIFDTWSDF